MTAGRAFESRLIVGTGKYKDGKETQAAIEASLVRGGSLETAVQFAIRAAHVCVTRPGAQDSIPYKRELR